MQSWGLRARWGERDSGDEPSKSGIIGLIGCALGYRRDDPRLVTEIDSNIRIGIRIENPGTPMKDYHTINDVSRGRENASTILTNRTYLQDASFLVVINGPEELLMRIKDALASPKWPIYLGRKSCPPTRPVFDGITKAYDSIEDAIKKYPWKATTLELREIPAPEQLRCVVENPGGNAIMPDKRLISPVRMYGNRKVKQYYIETPHEEAISCTSPD
jgi:CRISPR system Cascade subunit CasD